MTYAFDDLISPTQQTGMLFPAEDKRNRSYRYIHNKKVPRRIFKIKSYTNGLT